MRWDELTSGDVEKYAREKSAVCVVPLGCVEKHGEHLPLGADSYAIDRLLERVEKKEEILVFPITHFTIASSMKTGCGAINISPILFLEYLENVCDEIHRNGFKKIIIMNWHGGNVAIMKVFGRSVMNKAKPYIVYSLIDPWASLVDKKTLEKILETKDCEHACELETSWALSLYPELCKLDRIPKKYVHPVKRLNISPAITPPDFYAKYPGYYMGDARKANAKKGNILVNEYTDNLLKFIRKIKTDNRIERVTKEFYRKANLIK